MRSTLKAAVVVVSALSFISLSGEAAFAATTDQTSGGGDASNTSCTSTTVTITNGGDATSGSQATTGDCPYTTATTPTTPVTPGQGAGEATPATPAAAAPTVLPYTGPSQLGNVVAAVAATMTAGAALVVAGLRTLRG